VRGLAVTAPLQNVEKAGDIGVQISMGVLQRVPDPGLRREVHDRPKIAVAKQSFRKRPIGQIEPMKSEVV
jgi:hypothetical protein